MTNTQNINEINIWIANIYGKGLQETVLVKVDVGIKLNVPRHLNKMQN